MKKSLLYSILFLHCLFLNGALTSQEQELIDHVQTSIAKAELHSSNLSPEILNIDGMSSVKVRHLLNNLCSRKGTNYLEIGCWKGSTFVSSLFNNSESIHDAVGVDNWSQFDGPMNEFYQNCGRYLSENRFRFSDQESYSLSPKKLCIYPVNVYFYDGDHTAEAQELAFTYYNEIFDQVFIAIVDDWNHPPVPVGTRNAFEKLNYEILFEQVLPARYNGDRDQWWHGIYIAVIRKPINP